MKTNAELSLIVGRLRQHLERARLEHHAIDEAQIIHEFLAPYDLTATEHFGIVGEYRRRARAAPSDPQPKKPRPKTRTDPPAAVSASPPPS